IGGIQASFLLVLVLVGQKLQLSGFYYAGIAVAAGLMVYQQYLIRKRLPTACFKAFLNNNWLGMAVFAGIFLHYFYQD
nr:4-hydroxybenzoate octaprenyltransferase [Gammaproteobacteria bacterium]